MLLLNSTTSFITCPSMPSQMSYLYVVIEDIGKTHAVFASQGDNGFGAGSRASRCACVIPAHVLELNSPARHSMRRPTDRTSSHLKYRSRSVDKRFGNE